MYKIIKTNKKQVIKYFDTFTELMEYADKNRYTKGVIELYDSNNTLILEGYGHNLKEYTTKLYLKSNNII